MRIDPDSVEPRSVDAESYAIRFTPRKAGSNWSAINVARMAELTAAEAVTNVFEGGGTMQRLDLNDRRMSLIRARTIDLMEYSRQLSN